MNIKEKPKRATVYFEPDLHRALKLQAAETSTSLSGLINRAVREELKEDRDDLAVFDKRAGEATISFEEMLKNLDLDGKV